MSNTVILIAGPTASGKSGLALALAERIGGAVINADSMQVYRELRVLTARPSAKDEARAPHLLYGHVPGGDAYSAGRFAREAGYAIKEAQARGLVPIVTGGTGLYFKTLTEGLSPVPVIADDVRRYWRTEAEQRGSIALYAELARRDRVMASRLQPGDSQRITRALEVLDATGRSLAEWQKLPGEPVIDTATPTLRLVVMPERAEMHRRCDERFDAMMADGALDEARSLAALGLDPGLPIMRALGVRPLIQLDRGELSAEEAVRQAKAETRQFAKRQVTWLKGNMISWKLVNAQQMTNMLAEIMTFIRPSP
jgi:tRNA dimethylallyltransferase